MAVSHEVTSENITDPRAYLSWLFLFECAMSLVQLISCFLTTCKLVIRGLITLVIGVATFFKMPPSPTQTKTWFRPKGWFTEREETILVSRVLRDDPTKVGGIPVETTLY